MILAEYSKRKYRGFNFGVKFYIKTGYLYPNPLTNLGGAMRGIIN